MDDQISNKSRASRALIREATKKLIAELDPAVPLTVTLIAREAGINRATFYYHFETLELVLFDIVDSFIRSTEEIIEQYGSKLTGAILSNVLVGWFKKNQAFCTALIRRYPLFVYSEGRQHLSNGFFRLTAQKLGSKVEPPPSLLLFLSGLFVSTIDDLGQTGKPIDYLTLEGRLTYGFDLIWKRMAEESKAKKIR